MLNIMVEQNGCPVQVVVAQVGVHAVVEQVDVRKEVTNDTL